MIPKTIHQVWLGKKDIPNEFIIFVRKWKLMYPDFNYILWNDDSVKSKNIIPDSIMEFYEDTSFRIAFKADILRYHVLRKYGGVYVDMDTEPLRRMDDYIFDLNFFSGIQNNQEVAIGIFGNEIDNELMNNVCNSLKENINHYLSSDLKKTQIQFFTGPTYFNRICKQYFNKDGYKFFEPKYFYPYWFSEKNRRNEDFKITCPDAYSVHHWAASWRD